MPLFSPIDFFTARVVNGQRAGKLQLCTFYESEIEIYYVYKYSTNDSTSWYHWKKNGLRLKLKGQFCVHVFAEILGQSGVKRFDS